MSSTLKSNFFAKPIKNYYRVHQDCQHQKLDFNLVSGLLLILLDYTGTGCSQKRAYKAEINCPTIKLVLKNGPSLISLYLLTLFLSLSHLLTDPFYFDAHKLSQFYSNLASLKAVKVQLVIKALSSSTLKTAPRKEGCQTWEDICFYSTQIM